MQIPSKLPREAAIVFKGISFDIYQWQQELFDGSFATFEMAKRPNAVGIIPIIDDKLVILHEEQPTHAPHISFPGGHIDDGEDPLSAAVRELEEETGMTFKTFKLVGIEDHGNNRIDQWLFRFIATDYVSSQPPHTDPGERIRVEKVTLDEAKKLAKDNPYMPAYIGKMESLQQLQALPELHTD